jgi:hypothetical protein
MSFDLDTRVKLALYGRIADTGEMPTSGDLAVTTGIPEPEVRAAFARLHTKRLLVPEPGDPARLRMAPPFSGVPTPFPVAARGRRYFANCVWDAYGVAAALAADATIASVDAFTGEPLPLAVRDGRPVPSAGVCHFAVPAARWWEDIVHT